MKNFEYRHLPDWSGIITSISSNDTMTFDKLDFPEVHRY